MEMDNVLSLDRVQGLFNKLLSKGNRLYEDTLLGAWIAAQPGTSRRLFGYTARDYARLAGTNKADATKAARQRLLDRFNCIIQRRHDCIHNCDRPKHALQKVGGPNSVKKVVDDVEFLVSRCNDLFDRELTTHLTSMGCDTKTLNRLRYS